MTKQPSKKERSKQAVPSPLMRDRQEPSRGRKPRHTRTQIAKVAIGIADNEGIEAVSMRRVASEINSGTASLYRYVTKKDELLDSMVDYVLGEARLPKLSGSWRADLRDIAFSSRALALRHPWIIKISPVRASLGLNSIRWFEFRMRILDGLGLSIDEMIVLVNTLDNFVKGYSAAETAELEESCNSGIRYERWLASREEYVRSVVSTGEFPLFNRVVRDAKAPHDPERTNHEFVLAVEHILDGFAAHISRTMTASKSKRLAAVNCQRTPFTSKFHKKEPCEL
jgi:AcrR family transcriptional regulator